MRINRYSISIIQILEKKKKKVNIPIQKKISLPWLIIEKNVTRPVKYINVSLVLTELMLVLGPDPVTLIKSYLGIVSK